MLFFFTLFAFFSFASFAHLNADYTLLFNTSDLYFLQKLIHLSYSEDKNCTGPMKKKAIDAFIRYGDKNGFAATTQFGKGYKVDQAEEAPKGNKIQKIAFDPVKFGLPQDTQLTMTFVSRGIIPSFHFTLSPAMHDLVEKMLKEDNSAQSKV